MRLTIPPEFVDSCQRLIDDSIAERIDVFGTETNILCEPALTLSVRDGALESWQSLEAALGEPTPPSNHILLRTAMDEASPSDIDQVLLPMAGGYILPDNPLIFPGERLERLLARAGTISGIAHFHPPGDPELSPMDVATFRRLAAEDRVDADGIVALVFSPEGSFRLAKQQEFALRFSGRLFRKSGSEDRIDVSYPASRGGP